MQELHKHEQKTVETYQKRLRTSQKELIEDTRRDWEERVESIRSLLFTPNAHLFSSIFGD